MQPVVTEIISEEEVIFSDVNKIVKNPEVNLVIDGVNIATFIKKKLQSNYNLFVYNQKTAYNVIKCFWNILNDFSNDFGMFNEKVVFHVVFKNFCNNDILFRNIFIEFMKNSQFQVRLYWTAPNNANDKQCDDRLVIKLASLFNNSVIISNDRYRTVSVEELDEINNCALCTISNGDCIVTGIVYDRVSSIFSFDLKVISTIFLKFAVANYYVTKTNKFCGSLQIQKDLTTETYSLAVC